MEAMEFAVIHTGGKQYKVSEGGFVSIEKITGTYKKGDKISFDKVLLVDDGKTPLSARLISRARQSVRKL